MPDQKTIESTTTKAQGNGQGKTISSLTKSQLDGLRSEEVQEILGHIPHWTIRWGISSIFILLLIFFFLSWLIKYPEVISGQVVLTTANPPVRLVANNPGKLTRIYEKDGAIVKHRASIAEIENPVSQQGIQFLQSFLDAAVGLMNDPQTTVSMPTHSLVFGNIQPSFNRLQKLCLDYQRWATNPYELEKIRNLNFQIDQYEQLIGIALRQLLIAQKELDNAEEKYQAHQKLHEEGVLAKMDFYERETAFRQKQQSFENLRRTAVQNQITLNDLERQLMELKNEQELTANEFKTNILLAVREVENGIRNWQQGYQVSAPVDGKLVWLQQLTENQFVQAGQNLFAIVPEDEKYTGILSIPSQGFGRVSIGQQVRLRFDNYPYFEFGVVEGTIEKIYEIPEQNIYRAEVLLVNGLKTSYDKEIKFTPEMAGIAEVITDDLRLIERILHRFRKLLFRKGNEELNGTGS